MSRRAKQKDGDDPQEKHVIPILTMIALGSVEFLLSPLLLCYGLFLTEFALEDFYSLEYGIWTVIVFDSFWKIAYPWTKSYCKYLNSQGEPIDKRDLILSSMMLFLGIFVTSLINASWSQIFFYGAFGGTLSSIISTQLRYYCNNSFKNKPGLYYKLTVLFPKPISLLAIPHLLAFLGRYYGPSEAQLLYSAIILHIIPICLLIQPEKSPPKVFAKHRTLERLAVELAPISEAKSNPAIDDSSSDSGDGLNPDDNIPIPQIVIVEPHPEPQPKPETSSVGYPPSPRLGSLPEIPEENEIDEEDDINEITGKRLSQISAKLEEINSTTPQTLSVTNLYQPDETIEVLQEIPVSPEIPPEIPPKVIDEDEENPRIWYKCNSQCAEDWKWHRREMLSLAIDFGWKPFPKAFGKITFYPVVVSKIITTFLSTVFYAATPYIAVTKSSIRGQTMSTTESALLLSFASFSWLFSLIGFSVVKKLSPTKKRILFLIGLAFSGFGMYLSRHFTNDGLTGSCLLFGAGHCAITFHEDDVFEDFVGRRHWYKMQWHVESFTAPGVMLVYLLIYFFNFEIKSLLMLAFWPYIFNLCLWIIVPIIKYVVIYVSRTRRDRRQRYMHDL